MSLKKVIEHIELAYNRVKNFLPENERLKYQEIHLDQLKAVLLYGVRGSGKTTCLLKKIQAKNFLYFSADHPLILSIPLYDLVEAIFNEGYEGVVIDEIHFANEWSKHLKALYDDFPGHYLWISDSSSLVLRKGTADLSRRFVQIRLPMLSFREYIYFMTGHIFPAVNPFGEIPGNLLKKIGEIKILKLFKSYLSEGLRPIFFEGEYANRLKSILEKTIYSDIPFYVSGIKENHLRLMNAIVGHLIYSSVPTINIANMCSDWGVGKEKLYSLLHTLNYAEVIRIIYKEGDFKTYSKGAKIFMADPSFYFVFEGDIGSAREAFVTMALSEKFKIFACKQEKECDYIVDKMKIEVGGKNKKIKSADYVIRDDIDIPFGNKIPLWLLGMCF